MLIYKLLLKLHTIPPNESVIEVAKAEYEVKIAMKNAVSLRDAQFDVKAPTVGKSTAKQSP